MNLLNWTIVWSSVGCQEFVCSLAFVIRMMQELKPNLKEHSVEEAGFLELSAIIVDRSKSTNGNI